MADKKITNKELAAYLRCTMVTPARPCRADCPYLLKEEIKKELPLPADLVIEGIEYWTSCDIDRLTEDAASRLELSPDPEEDDEGTEVW